MAVAEDLESSSGSTPCRTLEVWSELPGASVPLIISASPASQDGKGGVGEKDAKGFCKLSLTIYMAGGGGTMCPNLQVREDNPAVNPVVLKLGLRSVTPGVC